MSDLFPGEMLLLYMSAIAVKIHVIDRNKTLVITREDIKSCEPRPSPASGEEGP